MAGQFDDLNQPPVRREPAQDQSMLRQRFPVGIVEFIPVPMPFLHLVHSVSLLRQGAVLNPAGIGAESHRASFVRHALLVRHEMDHRMRRRRVELGAVGAGQTSHMPGEFDHRALHAQAEAQKRKPALPRVANGFDLAFDAPYAESTGNQDAVGVAEQLFRAGAGYLLGFDPANLDPCLVIDPAVYQRGEEISDGRGGMGRTFRAVDRRLGRAVALKEMLPPSASTDPAARAVQRRRFEREARLTARLEHPSIVGVHEAAIVPEGDAVAHELALVKLRPSGEQYAELLDVVQLYHATLVDESLDAVVLELTGSEAFVLSCLRALERFDIVEVARSGAVAMESGTAGLRLGTQPQLEAGAR